jgi:peptidoglycan/LPS O-acetylase OafA/YrhL
MTEWTGHFWSLCVEMQFYLGIALLFALIGRKGLLLLPGLAIAVTIGRGWNGITTSIVTYYRLDEVLAGATLAVIYAGVMGKGIAQLLTRVSPYFVAGLLLVSCHTAIIAANYFRPYLAAALVGATLYQPSHKSVAWLRSRLLSYIAGVSYALYVIHPITTHGGWFNTEDKVLKYARRPIGIILTFTLAHLSTYYYESRWIALGKMWLRSESHARLPATVRSSPSSEP